MLFSGAEFDDEEQRCYNVLADIAGRALGTLGAAGGGEGPEGGAGLDAAFLHRLVKAYISLPFGGLYM